MQIQCVGVFSKFSKKKKITITDNNKITLNILTVKTNIIVNYLLNLYI